MSAQVIIAIIVAVVVSVLLFAVCLCFLRVRAKKCQKCRNIQDATDENTRSGTDENTISKPECSQYDLSTIEAATNNFCNENKIGKGGFGEVFKGKLANGEEIAVKRLSRHSRQGEFKNEVIVVANIHHNNLVRLVGFCLEREENILIYEFVSNKSLDYFLFDPQKQQLLDWPTRYKIIKGIALGILYLHECSRIKIIHQDLKASNVLLDEDMNPKISDFGMAQICGIHQAQAKTSRVVGTFGYMAPEYLLHGHYSVKSDIFSLGVLVLEIISGKKSNSFYHSGGSENLLNHAWTCWKDDRLMDFMDPTLGDSVVQSEVIQCINIGLLCVQEDADKRPTSLSVIRMLNNAIALALPQQPAYFVGTKTKTILNQLQSDSSSLPWSVNDISISELYPR